MSKKFLAFILGFFVLTGAAFFFVLHWGSQLPAPQSGSPPMLAPAPPAVPKTPGVTLTIKRSKKGNTLLVQWENLPENTAALDIFRSVKDKNKWSLWKTIAISSDQLRSGSATFNIGSATLGSYSFYIEAVSGGGGGVPSGTGVPNTTTLWTSAPTSVTIPTATSSPTTSGTIPAPSSTSPPITTSGTPATTSSSSSSSGTTSTPSGTPQGTPYYTPQLQISGYSPGQSGIFWVQHVDQKIQIGWQNLPAITTSIVIYRSANQDGPWAAVLAQGNPGVNGSYSIQVVDDTLGLPYYYKLNAQAGSTTIAAYGPAYLPPVGQ